MPTSGVEHLGAAQVEQRHGQAWDVSNSGAWLWQPWQLLWALQGGGPDAWVFWAGEQRWLGAHTPGFSASLSATQGHRGGGEARGVTQHLDPGALLGRLQLGRVSLGQGLEG